MLNRSFLSGIKELKVESKINSMSDKQFADFVKRLNDFIDSFPSSEAKIRKGLSDKKYALVTGELKDICAILQEIHADNIVKEYNDQIGKMGGMGADALQVLVENFVQRVSALSIDVQMAIHRNASATPRKAERIMGTQPVILAVDNALMFLHTLKKLLGDSPYNLQTTTSCSEALELCREIKPDVILMDIEMPEMDGYELARRIISSGCKAPIIFVTANSEREYVDKAIAVGAVGLLVKPLRLSQLQDKIKENI